MRRIRLCLLLAAVVLAATGCFRSDLAIEVNDDGSGTFSQVIAINPKALEQISGQMGESDLGDGSIPVDMCEEMMSDAGGDSSDLPDGAKVEPFRDGDFCGVTITVNFSDPSELQRIFGDISSQTESEGLTSLESLSIKRDGDGWLFEADPGAGDSSGAGDLGMFGDMMKGASNVVRVKLPGRQVDHNADRIDKDGTLIWNLDIFGDSRVLQARTEKGEPKTDEVITDAGKDVEGEFGSTGDSSSDDSSSTVWIIVGVVVVAAAVIGFVLWRRSKGGNKAASDAVAAGGGTPAGEASAFDTPAAPTGGGAASGGPQWDAQRNAYIQWDAAASRWMQFDDTTKEWKPIS